MSTIPESVNFQLSKPVEYAYEGETVNGKFITLYAPTKKQITQCIFLKQAFFRAINSISDGEQGRNDASPDTISASDVIGLLYTSDIDMQKVILSGIELLRTGAAKIEGVKDLTGPMLDQMTHDDIENCIGEYLANFIIASIMNRDN